MKVIFEYPLKWLPQQTRTKYPQKARFSQSHSPSSSGGMLIDELRRMGAKNCVISSNMQTKERGVGFYANQKVSDPGVVVYFQLKNKSKAIACDKWNKPEHNLWALYLTITAIRGLERWGGSELLDGLFDGFKALPSPDDVTVNSRRYFSGIESEDDMKTKYIELVKKLHPDAGGNINEFQEMKREYESYFK
jgi:hypothetical protein